MAVTLACPSEKTMHQAEFAAFLQSIHSLPEPVLEEALSCFRQLEYPRHYTLLRQDSPCRHLWILTRGAVRYFYTDDQGKEVNVWFSFENEVVTDASAFVTQSLAQEGIQLLEDSELYGISYEQLYDLVQKHHVFAIWYIRLVEKFYILQVEDRLADLQFLTARQRYEKLLGQFPGITNRISLGHIASYLNITQESLSRIRAGKL